MFRRAIGATTSLLLTVVLLATAATGTVTAAKKDKATPAPIESIKGVDYRMVKVPMADRVTRIADAGGDQAFRDGAPAPDAPKWSDMSAVYVAPTRMPAKLKNTMAVDYPAGAARAFYGNAADWKTRDRMVFVAVQMAKHLPADSGGQQVEIGLGGSGATPVQVGSHLDTRAGIERFELSGVFSDGSYATAATDVSGRQPGDPIEYYNAESGVFGFYEPRSATWYLIVPRAGGNNTLAISVRSSTEVGEVVDRLELPGGGHFIDLREPSGGWGKKTGLPPLSCRSLETFSAASGMAELADSAGTLIRYTVGVDASVEAGDAAKMLGPAVEAMGSVPVTLMPIGSEEEPLTVDGELAVSPAGNAVSLTFEAPPGQWRFGVADELKLKTPARESIIDHSTLTGSAGVLTGPGLDGFVAGDLSCAQVSEASEASEDESAQEAADDEPAPEAAG